jgi:hypothetical protein
MDRRITAVVLQYFGMGIGPFPVEAALFQDSKVYQGGRSKERDPNFLKWSM